MQIAGERTRIASAIKLERRRGYKKRVQDKYVRVKKGWVFKKKKT